MENNENYSKGKKVIRKREDGAQPLSTMNGQILPGQNVQTVQAGQAQPVVTGPVQQVPNVVPPAYQQTLYQGNIFWQTKN